MGLPGQPVLSGYREGEAWDGSLACLSESHAIKDLMRSIKRDNHSDWSAKGGSPACGAHVRRQSCRLLNLTS